MNIRKDSFANEARFVRKIVRHGHSWSQIESIHLFSLYSTRLFDFRITAIHMNQLLDVHVKGPQINAFIVKEEQHSLHIGFAGTVVPRVWKDLGQESLFVSYKDASSRHSFTSKKG